MSQGTGPRVVAKYVEGINVELNTANDPPFSLLTKTNQSGWVIADASAGIFHWQGFIDLSGYRPDDMVLVPQAIQCQYGATFGAGGAGAGLAGGEVFLQYALTTDKIDDLSYGTAGEFEPLAGYIGDNTDMSQVIYGCSEAWGPSATGVNLVNHQKMEYGDGVPIVGPRIYLAIRVKCNAPVVSGSVTNGQWFIPPMRFVIAGNAAEVPEFQLLHLMARQIDLQQTPDVDL